MTKNVRKPSSYIIYILYFIGFLDLFAVSIRLPLMLSYLKSLGFSSFLSGIISSVYGGIQLFSSPVVGRAGDVHGRRVVLLMCLVATVISTFILGLAQSVFWVVTSRVIAGLFKHSQVLGKSILADLTPAESHCKVFGIFNAFSSGGFILGPLVGGYLSEFENGFYLSCIISGLIFLFSFLLCWALVPNVEKGQQAKSRKKDTSKSSPNSRSWIGLWDIFLATFLLSYSTIVYRSNFSLVLQEQLGITAKTVGYLISFQGIVSAVCGFFTDYICSFYTSHSVQYLHFSFLLTFSLVGLTFAPDVRLMFLFLMLLSISTTVMRVVNLALTIQRSPPKDVGSITGFSQTVLSVSRMVSPVSAGAAQDVSLYGPGILSCISSGLGTMVVGYISWKSKKHKLE